MPWQSCYLISHPGCRARDCTIPGTGRPAIVLHRCSARTSKCHGHEWQPPEHGACTTGETEVRLRNCLEPRVRRWAACEFFCSAIDRPWLMRNELTDYLGHVGIPKGTKLSRPELAIIRASLGKPRAPVPELPSPGNALPLGLQWQGLSSPSSSKQGGQ